MFITGHGFGGWGTLLKKEETTLETWWFSGLLASGVYIAKYVFFGFRKLTNSDLFVSRFDGTNMSV